MQSENYILQIMERIRGIVIRQIKYGEKEQIVDLFTDTHGRMSVIMKRGHMPLAMIEFDCNLHGQGKLPRPHNIVPYYTYRNIQFEPIKSTLAMFTAEFLSNALREEMPDTLLYKYIEESLQWLDCTDCGISNFHIAFLLHLSRFLGIEPNLEGHSSTQHFDMISGEYCSFQPKHPHFLRPEEARVIPYLSNMTISNMHLYRFSRKQRQRILEILSDYYRIHIPNFHELKSLEVLKEIFD